MDMSVSDVRYSSLLIGSPVCLGCGGTTGEESEVTILSSPDPPVPSQRLPGLSRLEQEPALLTS